MKYVVTDYWNNGESWEDEMQDERPVKVFNSMQRALEYISKFGKIKEGEEYTDYIYYATEEIETVEIGDNSFWEYRIYEVEEGD